MKKLYTLVFLIINFNQILCSTASNPVTFKIGEDITFKDDKYFVNLEISNNGVKYSRTFRLPGAILDVSKNKDGQTLYSFKPYAKTVLSNIILPYTEEILDFVLHR